MVEEEGIDQLDNVAADSAVAGHGKMDLEREEKPEQHY